MKITFLGTGTSQGVPVIACKCAACTSGNPKDNRMRSSVLVEEKETVIVIDTGPDFRMQMLREDVRRLDAILFTHEHRDHIAGLDDIRSFNFIQDRPMDAYGEERVLRALQHQFPYIFAERKYPGIPQVNFHPITTEPFRIGELEIIPIRAMHYRLPVLGFRIGGFSYITDTNYISREEKEKIRGSEVLSVCALRREKHISHYTLAEALELIRDIDPVKACLSHVSHMMGPVASLQDELPDNVEFAWDGLSLTL